MKGDRVYQKFQKIILCLFIALLLWLIPSETSFAAAEYLLTYDGKTVSYTGKQASVQLDGSTLAMGGTPGILINGYALVSCKDIFISGLGVDCTYNSTTKLITIEQNDVLIKMALGSTEATVNGVKKKLSIAPRKVKYHKSNTTKILVPARFVAESLGYTYTWDGTISTISIKSPWKIYYDNGWHVYNGTQGKVTVDSKKIDVSAMPSVIIDSTALVQAKKVFHLGVGADYILDKSKNTLTLSKNGNTIIMTLGRAKAIVNNKEYTMDTEVRVIKNSTNQSNYIMVPGSFVAKHLGYSYSWSKSSKTSVIKTVKEQDPELDGDENVSKNYVTWTSTDESVDGVTYTNLLKGLRADYSNKNDIITLEGLSALNATVLVDNTTSSLIIDIPGTMNGIGEKLEQFADGYCIQSIAVTSIDNATRVTIQKSNDSEYYTSASGNKFMIMLFQGTKESYGLQFNKPDEVKYTAITHSDHYYDNEFIITVPGNYVDYYTNNPVIINNDVISGVNVTLNSSGNTDITVTTTRLQGYRLNDKGSYITVDIGNPADIYKNIVVLDAGHGGTDPGAQKSGVSEKDINFSIIYEKAEKYFNSPDSTVKAYWTRTTDTFVTLDDRAAFADSVGADLFISLHVNSFNKSSVSGMEIYYSPSNNDTNQAGLSSSMLADYFNSQLKGDLNLVNHGQGVKTAKYVVVHKNSVPAILIELGFITNETDLANMTDETFQDNFAKSIFTATTGVFNQYPSGR